MIPAIVLNWFRTNPRNIWLIVGLVAVIGVLGFVYLKGRGDYAKQERARDAIAAAEALKSNDRANAKADQQAQVDALNRVNAEKELTNAVADIPDTVPDPVAVQLGCQRLRQAGVSTADLPVCQSAGR